LVQQDTNSNNNMSFNQSFLDTNILSLRLDTQRLLSEIKTFLKGSYIERVADANGNVELKEIITGSPLMNDDGVQSIINTLRLTFSPHTVQGNFTDDDFRSFIAEMDKNFSCNLMINLDRWDIDENDYDHIIDSIMSSAQMFVSRLIDNKERDSYAATMKSVESNTISDKKGLLSFGGNNNG